MQYLTLYSTGDTIVIIIWIVVRVPFINPNPLGCVQNRIQIGGFGTVRVNYRTIKMRQGESVAKLPPPQDQPIAHETGLPEVRVKY